MLNARLGNRDAVVLIEIGGNDYFESLPPSDFDRDLDRLLTELSRPNRQLIMLELPLPPFYNGYGRVQRELAARHHVPLISKREFARVVFASEATLDTVHLSESGHSLFADMLWRHVGPLLRTPSVESMTPSIDSMTVYSLQASQTVRGENFNTYVVLGKIDITAPNDRIAILTAVHQGIDDGGGLPAWGCFEPHHGLRLRRNGKTIDYVLCFHCGNVDEFVDGKFVSEKTMTSYARNVLDKYLKAAGVPQDQSL